MNWTQARETSDIPTIRANNAWKAAFYRDDGHHDMPRSVTRELANRIRAEEKLGLLSERLGEPEQWLTLEIAKAKNEGRWVRIFHSHAWLSLMLLGISFTASAVVLGFLFSQQDIVSVATIPAMAVGLAWALAPVFTDVLYYRAEDRPLPWLTLLVGLLVPWAIASLAGLAWSTFSPQVLWWTAGGGLLLVAAGFSGVFWEYPNIPECRDERWRTHVRRLLRRGCGYTYGEVESLFDKLGISQGTRLNDTWGNPVAFASENSKPAKTRHTVGVWVSAAPYLCLVATSAAALAPGITHPSTQMVAFMSVLAAGALAFFIVTKLHRILGQLP